MLYVQPNPNTPLSIVQCPGQKEAITAIKPRNNSLLFEQRNSIYTLPIQAYSSYQKFEEHFQSYHKKPQLLYYYSPIFFYPKMSSAQLNAGQSHGQAQVILQFVVFNSVSNDRWFLRNNALYILITLMCTLQLCTGWIEGDTRLRRFGLTDFRT